MSLFITHVLSMVPVAEKKAVGDAVLHEQKPVQFTLWTFPWNTKETVGGEEFLVRDVVNSYEFRERLAEILSVPGFYTAAPHTLEHDYHVSPHLKVVKDEAILIVTFTFDNKHCECGKALQNGRATCLCWADEEDLARMDRDLALRHY